VSDYNQLEILLAFPALHYSIIMVHTREFQLVQDYAQ
jgi:hypothetical protein